VDDREVPVPRRVEPVPVRPEPVHSVPDCVLVEVVARVRAESATAATTGTGDPTGARPQRSQNPWSIVPPHLGYWHRSAGMVLPEITASQDEEKKTLRGS
jgi:hypothetical protein